tara:strand:+ start:500 stop:1168 length:669 start_codon:yes stop_codon:yes gene_type:complete
MRDLLLALSEHRELSVEEGYSSEARKESPEILDWCQDDKHLDIMLFTIYYTQFSYLSLEVDDQSGFDDMPLFAEHFFMQSQEHRRLGLLLMLAYTQASTQKIDAVGVPQDVALKAMKCTNSTARRIVKSAIEAGFVGQFNNKRRRCEKVLYATEATVHGYLNKTYRFFHNKQLKQAAKYASNIRNKIDDSFGEQVPNISRMKIMNDWLKTKGKKFKNGRIVR